MCRPSSRTGAWTCSPRTRSRERALRMRSISSRRPRSGRASQPATGCNDGSPNDMASSGPSSAVGVTLDGVEVPAENLRVTRAAFGAVWSLAEDLGRQPGDGGAFLLGVIRTCRWLADQPFWSQVDRRAVMPTSPYTRQQHGAMPETIDEEYLAAVTPRGLEPGLARGVAATLEWTWHGSARPPLDISHAAAS